MKFNDSPITLNSSFITAWYPGGKRTRTAIHVIFTDIKSTDFHFSTESDFTFILQTEGALIFASLVLQDDLVNTHIRLGDLEFKVKSSVSILGGAMNSLLPQTDGNTVIILGTDKKTERAKTRH